MKLNNRIHKQNQEEIEGLRDEVKQVRECMEMLQERIDKLEKIKRVP